MNVNQLRVFSFQHYSGLPMDATDDQAMLFAGSAGGSPAYEPQASQQLPPPRTLHVGRAGFRAAALTAGEPPALPGCTQLQTAIVLKTVN